MPRGRERQTPREAWFDSAGRILASLSERSAKGFNRLLAEMLFEDRLRRGLITGLDSNDSPSVKRTGDVLRGLPRIFVLEVRWDRVADGLDAKGSQDLWHVVLRRANARIQKRDRTAQTP